MIKCPKCNKAVKLFMNYCTNCGCELCWEFSPKNDLECCSCGANNPKTFNYCYACGEDINPNILNKPIKKLSGLNLAWECDHQCGGYVQDFMSFCPTCGEEINWGGVYGKKDHEYCDCCNTNVNSSWKHCPFCGDKINLVDNSILVVRCHSCRSNIPVEEQGKLDGGLCFVCGKFVCADCLRMAHIINSDHINSELRNQIPAGYINDDYPTFPVCESCYKKLPHTGLTLYDFYP